MSLPERKDFDITSSMGTILDLVRIPDEYSGSIADLRDVQSINAAVDTVYEDIRRMLQDTLYLKRYRNSLGGYGSLPSEILSEIFRWCPKKRETVDDQCYAFSQVCHRWRVASIADKTLWTTPDLLHPHLAMEMYKSRTAYLPLHVHFPDLFGQTTYDRDVVLQFPSGISERAQSIDISYSRLGTDEDPCAKPESAIDEFFRYSERFPMLKSLSLRSGDQHSRAPFYMGKDAPLLRSVTLENCLFSWHSYVFDNLTSLIIVLKRSVYLNRDFVDRNQRSMLGLLKRNPNLETLVLKDVVCRGGLVKLIPPTSNDLTPVEFAHMKSLTIVDNIDNVAPLVRLLKVPFASRVEIEADLTKDPESRAHVLLEDLGRSSVKFLELNGWTTKFHHITISFNDNCSAARLTERHDHGDIFSLQVLRPGNHRYTYHTHAWSRVLSTTLLIPSINHVTCRRGNEARNMPMDSCCAALSKLPALQTLELFDTESKPRMVEDLLPTLEPRSGDGLDTAQTFPALNTLYIKEIEMFKKVSESHRESVFQKLDSVFARRKMAGENIPDSTWLKECSFIEPLEVVISASKNDIMARNPRIIETE